MAQAVFKIENFFPASFGGRGIPFPGVPSVDNSKAIAESFEELPQSVKVSPETYGLNQYSLLGYKFYMPVGFIIDSKLYQLPWEPSMSIEMKKTIVKTPLAGNTRRGTVKELINTDDLVINIQGICLDHTKRGYPEDQVNILRAIFDYNGSIEIVSYLTRLFEIERVVIESKSLPAITGRPYSQPYMFTAISDEDFILIQD